MKLKFLTLTIVLSLLICAVFSACTSVPQNPVDSTVATTVSTYELQIKELEQRISELQNKQNSADKENEELIKELQNKIEELKKQSTGTAAPATTSHLPKSIFIYSINNGNAIISGFTGNDASIVIPSEIDGFKVYGIATNAFKDYPFKSVIVSDGIEVIDWFAFYNCSNLSSITIPNSVRKIGHSAFSGCAKNFTIYCNEGSFAQNYAASYGIPYAIM